MKSNLEKILRKNPLSLQHLTSRMKAFFVQTTCTLIIIIIRIL